MGFLGRKLTAGERAEELFSPYIDGQVTAEERTFLERHLADHPESRAKFEMLKAAVQLTKRLPPVKAPRSFVLPRSMARKPTLRLPLRLRSGQGSGLALRLYPVMRFATVAATALFVFALVGDLVTASRFATSPAAQSVPLGAGAQATAAATATQEPAAPAAEVPGLAATEAMTAQSSAFTVTETLPAPTPSAAAEDAAATDTSVTDGSPAARAAAPAPTEAPPEESTAGDEQDRSALKSTQAPTSAQLDLLRVAVIVLAGLVITLAATTLVLRRRAQ